MTCSCREPRSPPLTGTPGCYIHLLLVARRVKHHRSEVLDPRLVWTITPVALITGRRDGLKADSSRRFAISRMVVVLGSRACPDIGSSILQRFPESLDHQVAGVLLG